MGRTETRVFHHHGHRDFRRISRGKCDVERVVALVLFQQLHAQGRTIIFVTHNPEIARYSSRNVTLRDGHIISDVRNEEILSAAEALAKLPATDD